MIDISCLYSEVKGRKRITPKRATEKWLLANNPELFYAILKFTEEEKCLSIIERIYLVEKGLHKRSLCKTCGINPVAKINILYCSNSCAIKSPETQEKTRKTCVEKFGKRFNHINKEKYELGEHHLHKNLRNISDIKDTDFMNDIIENKTWKEIANHFGLTTKSHSSTYNFLRNAGYEPKIACGSSRQEKEILEFTTNICNDIVHNSKNIIKPFELDIFSPSKRIAIEYNGLFWHSFDRKETKKERYYHLNKTHMCESNNIQLLHFFENEWIHKRQIIESMIKSKFGSYDIKLNGRDCYIKEIRSDIYKKFCDDNHLQGYCQAKIKLGAFTVNNKLVSVMSFSKPRFQKNKNICHEIIRFCSELNTTIRGIFPKFLSYAEKNYGIVDIISFGNRRWCNINNNVYLTNGFSVDSITGPNYFYFDKYHNIISRYKSQKHKLVGIAKFPDQTESEIMFSNGYRRVWDCGSIKFIRSKK
jgi:hypothetical protein